MSEPAGIVMPFAGSVAPDGWLLCDGSAVSRSDYSDLFEVIGTTYGDGDGASTFNLPDLSGRVVIGVSESHALGSTGGEASHVLTSTELPAHVHEVPQHGHDNDITATTPELSHNINAQPSYTYLNSGTQRVTTQSGAPSVAYSGTSTATASRNSDVKISNHDDASCTVNGSVTECAAFQSGDTGEDAAHNNMQPYVSVSYIISTGG